MVKTTSSNPLNVQQQHQAILKMLTEIAELQKELIEINIQLLAVTEHTCSQYGDRILENMQHKLFYLQGILENNTHALNKHKNVLKEIINGSLTKPKKELDDYYNFCEKSAGYIRLKIENYMFGAKKFIRNNCEK